jgi:putative transposase
MNTIAVGVTHRYSWAATCDGWRYLRVVLDAFRRKGAGWALGKVLNTDLVPDALQMAHQVRFPGPGLTDHPEPGVHTEA